MFSLNKCQYCGGLGFPIAGGITCFGQVGDAFGFTLLKFPGTTKFKTHQWTR